MHPTENLRENFAQKKLKKFWKFFFENFSIKHFQSTSERSQATNTRACGHPFVKNKRKSWFQVLLKHAICRKTREKNASYRKPKENFRTKKVAKILKIFFSKTSVLNLSRALPNVPRRLTHGRVATLSWKISENRDFRCFWNMQYVEKQGKKTHPTENLRKIFAQKKLQKFWKFFSKTSA